MRFARRRGIAFVEHEVDHAQHVVEARGELRPRGDFIGNARVADLSLRAHDALRERGRRREECRGDLLGLEAAHFAQRQRDLRVGSERRMAAGEDQAQAVVLDRLGLRRLLGGDRLDLAVVERVVARAPPDAVDRLEAPGGDEPCARIVRNAFGGPLLERGAEGVMQRFFRDLEIAEQAHECGENAPRFGAVERLDRLADRVAHAVRLLTASAMHAGQRQPDAPAAGSTGG